MKKSHAAVIVATALLAGVGAGNYFRPLDALDANAPSARAFAEKDIALDCITPRAIEATRQSGSLDAISTRCEPELSAIFGARDPSLLRAILATIVAANFAEYGSSSGVTYADIKDAKYLNCGNTIFLTGHLFGDLASEHLRSIGFEGGAVGNHAQLLFLNGDTQFLLDPTTGLIAQTTFDDLVSGAPVPEEKIWMFGVKAKTIDKFRDKVYRAVGRGEYDPSDFMYMHESLLEHQQKGSSHVYFTPGGITLRDRLRK